VSRVPSRPARRLCSNTSRGCHAERRLPSEIEAIYRESHALWGAGLSYSDYVEFWATCARRQWARDHYRHLVWADGRGGILSSLKLYRPEVRWATVGCTRPGSAPSSPRCVIAGKAMRRPCCAPCCRTPCGEAMPLRSSSPTSGRSTTRVWDSRRCRRSSPGAACRRGSRAAAGLSLRPMDTEDLGQVRGAHDAWCGPRPFAFLRGPAALGLPHGACRQLLPAVRRVGPGAALTGWPCAMGSSVATWWRWKAWASGWCARSVPRTGTSR
jgi:hypothetical protein